jgi:hypothetical protein
VGDVASTIRQTVARGAAWVALIAAGLLVTAVVRRCRLTVSKPVLKSASAVSA